MSFCVYIVFAHHPTAFPLSKDDSPPQNSDFRIYTASRIRTYGIRPLVGLLGGRNTETSLNLFVETSLCSDRWEVGT